MLDPDICDFRFLESGLSVASLKHNVLHEVWMWWCDLFYWTMRLNNYFLDAVIGPAAEPGGMVRKGVETNKTKRG